jgi:hypothetical protein
MSVPSSFEAVAEALRSGRARMTPLAGGGGLLLNTETLDVDELNETGVVVVEALERGAPDVRSVARYLAEKFDVREDAADADVRALLTELASTVRPRARRAS